MILLDFEKEIINSQKGATLEVSDAAINEKYEKGEARIITEQGAVKLSLVNQVFNSENYELQPKYQRRITWDSKKRSKLIESFIMNIPVPPVFIYETDFNRCQVMDGLQRITAIIDFYKDCYELEELTQWPELNGKKYSQLPRKVKEGIDRRQLSVITLLSLDVVCHFPLNMLIKNPELLNEQECQYAMNPATHLDFLIYNRIGKKPVLAIEVDGYEYHKEDTVQASRDLLKNHIMELYEVPLLRFMTNGSGEKEKIIEMLDKLVG